MADVSANLYSGEDQSPVVDYTDLVIWEESEFGTRAWQGEGTPSTVVIRDPLGETGNAANLPSGLSFKTLPAKSLFVIKVGTDFLFRGRIGIKNYSRDDQRVERYRQIECQLHDTNWDLDHIFVHGHARPEENDKQRVQGLMAAYLSGSPRATTNLNGSNFISSSNTVTLTAHTYDRTTPLAAIREIALTANKQFFVTGDAQGGGSLFYDGNDSNAYASTLSISDRASEVNYTTVFPPIWNVGPASTEDGSELLSEVILFYGQTRYVRVSDPVIASQYGYAAGVFFDDTTTSLGAATQRAGAILAHREYEDKTVNVTIGPLTDAQVVLIKHGMTIPIKARAITYADDQSFTMRVVQCRYTRPAIGTWFAHLQLGRPWKMAPYGKGNPDSTDIADITATSTNAAGFMPFAYPIGGSPTDTGTTTLTLAANGGSLAFPVELTAPLDCYGLILRNTDTTLQRSFHWAIYQQMSETGPLLNEEDLTRVMGGATFTFTASAASTRSSESQPNPTRIGPGIFWCVIRNAHATNTFGLGVQAAGTLAMNMGQTKTLPSLPDPLDFTAATWVKVTSIPNIRLHGNVFGATGF